MSCYVPMIEKLKSAISHKDKNSIEEQIANSKSSSNACIQRPGVGGVPAKEIQQIFPYENNKNKNDIYNITASRADIAPKREIHGLTFTQNVGVFPRQVSLEIRHTHPSLGLNEVAHQRQRHSQVEDNLFPRQCQMPSNVQQQQSHYQNLQQQPKGVLSLGLPPSMIPRGFATAKRPQQLHQTQTATSEAIHHYYETLSPKYANIVTMQQQRHKVYDDIRDEIVMNE